MSHNNSAKNGHKCPACGIHWGYAGCFDAVATWLCSETPIHCPKCGGFANEDNTIYLDDFTSWVRGVRSNRIGDSFTRWVRETSAKAGIE